MKIKFAISSNINFYKITQPIIVNSLIESGVPEEDIYFFIGGYNEYRKIHKRQNIYEVNHNSFDFTSLISVIELELEADYWFLLHDTCYVGPNFYKKVLSSNYSSDVIALTEHGFSMNIASYKQSYINDKKTEILQFKNVNYDIESINNIKRLCVHLEDILIKNSNSVSYYTTSGYSEGPYDFYKNGTMRIIEHYPDIDLHKVKSNWIGKDIYEINL